MSGAEIMKSGLQPNYLMGRISAGKSKLAEKQIKIRQDYGAFFFLNELLRCLGLQKV